MAATSLYTRTAHLFLSELNRYLIMYYVYNRWWRTQTPLFSNWKNLPHPSFFRCDQWAEEVGKDEEEDRVEVQTDGGVWKLKDQGRCRVLLPLAMQKQPSIWRSSELSVKGSPAELHTYYTSDCTIQSLCICTSLYILYINIFSQQHFTVACVDLSHYLHIKQLLACGISVSISLPMHFEYHRTISL